MSIKFETFRGKGPGGQHRNKTDSCVRATDTETGVSVVVDGRSQSANKRQAVQEIKARNRQLKLDARSAVIKARRDERIHDHTIIRHYDFKRKVVRDLRSGRTAPLKEVLDKGNLDLVR